MVLWGFVVMKVAMDRVFRWITLVFSAIVVGLATLLFIELLFYSKTAFEHFGLKFLFGAVWDPVKRVFGAFPFIYGTFLTSTIAIAVAFPLSLGIAVALSEILPKNISDFLTSVVELIAAIPSVVIGLWGIFYLVPLIKTVIYRALRPLSFIPLFSGRTLGFSYLAAILVLIFMITPIMTSIYKAAFDNVPRELKEALYALGATRYEVIRNVSIPATRSALLAGGILAYGRAIGETLAVTMVIGNKPNITLSLLAPGYTIASVIANEFLEATNAVYISSLIALGFILFVISFAINFLGTLILRRGIR